MGGAGLMQAEAWRRLPCFGIPKQGIFTGFLSPTRTQADARLAASFFFLRGPFYHEREEERSRINKEVVFKT